MQYKSSHPHLQNPYLQPPHPLLPPLIPIPIPIPTQLPPHGAKRHIPILPIPHRDQILLVLHLHLEAPLKPKFLFDPLHEAYEALGARFGWDHDVPRLVPQVRFDS